MLAVLYVTFALGVHLLALMNGELTEIGNLLKALGMAGGALALSGLFEPEPAKTA